MNKDKHKIHWKPEALMQSLALSQTLVYTARPWIQN